MSNTTESIEHATMRQIIAHAADAATATVADAKFVALIKAIAAFVEAEVASERAACDNRGCQDPEMGEGPS